MDFLAASIVANENRINFQRQPRRSPDSFGLGICLAEPAVHNIDKHKEEMTYSLLYSSNPLPPGTIATRPGRLREKNLRQLLLLMYFSAPLWDTLPLDKLLPRYFYSRRCCYRLQQLGQSSSKGSDYLTYYSRGIFESSIGLPKENDPEE